MKTSGLVVIMEPCGCLLRGRTKGLLGGKMKRHLKVLNHRVREML